MNYAIIENDASDLARLRGVLAGCLPAGQLAWAAASVSQSVALLSGQHGPGHGQPQPLDVLFMDIELDDGYCFDIFGQVDLHDTPVVFTTAYSDYVLRAFKVNCVDYLLKPITAQQVIAALGKLRLYRQRQDVSKIQRQDVSKIG